MICAILCEECNTSKAKEKWFKIQVPHGEWCDVCHMYNENFSYYWMCSKECAIKWLEKQKDSL